MKLSGTGGESAAAHERSERQLVLLLHEDVRDLTVEALEEGEVQLSLWAHKELRSAENICDLNGMI